MKWSIIRKSLVTAAFSTVVTLAGCPNEPVQDGPAGDLLQPPPDGANGQPDGQQGAGPAVPDGQQPPEGGGTGQDNVQTSGSTSETASTGPDGGPEGAGGNKGDAMAPLAPVPDGVAGPDGAKGVGMFVKLESLPPQILDQSTLTDSASAIKLSGTISGAACNGKTVRLDALELRDGRPELMTAKTKRGIGPFEMYVPKSENKVWITAFCDVDDDGMFEGGSDYAGAYEKNPIIPKSNDFHNITITLTQDPPSLKNGVLVKGNE